MIRQLLLQNADAPFLVGPAGTISRAEAAERIAVRSAGIHKVGIVPLEIEPSADAVLELLAVLAGGRVAAPLNLREPAPIREGLHSRLEATPVPSGSALLVRTSGTTTEGKWVWLDLESLLHGATCAARALDFGEGDRWLLNLPLYHVGGLGPIWRALVGGGALALPSTSFSHASVVAAQLQRLLENGIPRPWKACRRALLGGGPVPEGLLESAAARGLQVTSSYGMTESGSLCVADGRAIGSCELRSHEGEIQLRGPALFRGYLDLVTGNLARPDAGDGWFPTGDLGRIDEAVLTVRGRRDNQFVSGGENIQPEEIESALLAIEGIDEAVVVPVPDQRFGLRPVAFIRPYREGLGDQLRVALPGFRVPTRFLPLPVPNDGALKPRRAELARLALRTDL